MKVGKQKEREIIFNKYGGRCAYCGSELQKGWHVDHIEPIGRKYRIIPAGWVHFGTPSQRWVSQKKVQIQPKKTHLETIENKNPSCPSCNINKHEMGLEEFRKQIKSYMKYLNNDCTQYKLAKRFGLVTENDIVVKFYFETI